MVSNLNFYFLKDHLVHVPHHQIRDAVPNLETIAKTLFTDSLQLLNQAINQQKTDEQVWSKYGASMGGGNLQLLQLIFVSGCKQISGSMSQVLRK